MITRLWSLTLLVTQLVLAYDHKIDFGRCKTDTACFIRESCFEDKSDSTHSDFSIWQKTLVQFKDEADKLKGKDCDVVLQMKGLSYKQFHVMMQVNGEKLKKDEGLKLDQGTTQFHCKPNSEPKGRAEFELKNEGEQEFSETRIFCSFRVKLLGADLFIVQSLNFLIDEAPTIIIKKDSVEEELPFKETKAAMWQLMPVKCDHSLISSSDKAGTETVLKEMNTFSNPPFTCPNGIIIESGSTPEKTDKVICDNNKWNKEVGGVKTVLTGSFSMSCSEKICQQCKGSSPTKLEGDDYTAFESKEVDGCPIFTCPDNAWTLTGKEIIDAERAECRATKADPPKYAWFLKETELEKAACIKKIDCGKRFGGPDKYPNVAAACPNGPDCRIKGLGTNELTCADDKKHEWKLSSGKNISGILKCDYLTGQFRKGEIVIDSELIDCVAIKSKSEGDTKVAGASAANFFDDNKGFLALGGCILFGIILAIIIYCAWGKKYIKGRKKAAAVAKTETTSAKAKTDASTNKSTASSISSAVPDIVVDSSEGKKKSSRKSRSRSKGSKKSKREKEKEKEKPKEKKFRLDDYPTWDNEVFNKKILPNFKKCDPDAQSKWIRTCLGRFYAYCNTKKTPESGTFQQFWLLVKQCVDDKCEVASVWEELFRIEFTMGYSIVEKNDHLDTLRLLLIKPFEWYMQEHIKKCDYHMVKDEPRHVTEMRMMCLMILIHTRNTDVTETLRKLTYSERLEVPLRMMTAACYTRERDNIGVGVQLQYKKILDTGLVDPHVSEGWGNYLQHCLFGLGGFLITTKEIYQHLLFDAIYQFPLQTDAEAPRRFSPTDWLFAYKGACLHENSAKIALEIFYKMNATSMLHIETYLKQKFEDPDERAKAKEEYKRSMKEYTQLLATLLIGEEEFKVFQPHLRFVMIFVGDQAKCEEPLDEDRIRERAINMHNMIRDRNWAKESCDCLKAIGAKVDK